MKVKIFYGEDGDLENQINFFLDRNNLTFERVRLHYQVSDNCSVILIEYMD